jgi:hypothetical protein
MRSIANQNQRDVIREQSYSCDLHRVRNQAKAVLGV